MAEKVYLFRQNYLALPETQSDAEAVNGVDSDLVEAAFGKLEYYKTPAIDDSRGTELLSIPGFLLPPDRELPAGWRDFSVRQAVAETDFVNVRGEPHSGAGGISGNVRAAQMLRSYHILQWRKDSVYCGSCGGLNGDAPAELARLCPRCGRVEYPRISPAIITLVIRDDGRALLAHNRKFKNSVYSLIAGFTEAGESLEATVLREVKEEVNIDVHDVRYITSQSWPFPNSLMVGFTARYARGELKPDGKEIIDAQWFSRESVLAGTPELPAPGSVSRFIIKLWTAGKL
jgi:NAD+ diphosphatase